MLVDKVHQSLVAVSVVEIQIYFLVSHLHFFEFLSKAGNLLQSSRGYMFSLAVADIMNRVCLHYL